MNKSIVVITSTHVTYYEIVFLWVLNIFFVFINRKIFTFGLPILKYLILVIYFLKLDTYNHSIGQM